MHQLIYQLKHLLPVQAMQALLITLIVTGLGACEPSTETKNTGTSTNTFGNTAPSASTVKHNLDIKKRLNLDDQQDFIDARRGLIAQEEELIIKKSDGKVVWDMSQYDFIEGEAPDSVNPSLWRQAKLNNIHGLFKVSEGIYQIRGYDLANMTIIEGDTGWIIVDPLTAAETAQRAIQMVRQHLPNKPIKAIIFTHSHIDHFGGIFGLVSPEQAEAEKIRLIAPQGFMEEVTSENVLVGLAMGRRAMLMYGKDLERSATGHVGSGLGKSPAYGTFGLLQPTELINQTPQKLIIDGLEFIFQYTPESEAPAELTFYLPKHKAFCGAEVISRNMHNLYTLRGAKVRDALKWSHYIEEASQLFSDSEIYFASHHWPMWGNKNIIPFLKKQRDGYKYIHDQSVRLINNGYTPKEIANELSFPESLESSFPNRGYYGTLKHNAKAVYQNYMGWYDANPANLDPIPPTEASVRYIKMMGGANKVINEAQQYFDKGEYNWVAELLNHLVFAEPNNTKAKALLASTYDQLGYRSESGPWRDVYLSAAMELRHGVSKEKLEPALMKNVLKETPIAYFLDAIAVNLNGPKADGVELILNFNFTDLNENYVITIENAVFHYQQAPASKDASATMFITRQVFLDLIIKQAKGVSGLLGDDFRIEGSRLDFVQFLSLLQKPTQQFNIVTP